MLLIKPKQISGDIMTLFEEADQKVIVVSPYYKVTKWDKLLNCLDSLKRRKIDIEFYVRENEWDSINELKAIGFNPVTIKNLHTKLYMNEKYAIVSSMNLNLSSDTNSLDIAMKTQSPGEYAELFDYYKRYIKVHSDVPLPKQQGKYSVQVVSEKSVQKTMPVTVPKDTLLSFAVFQLSSENMDYSNWKEIIDSWIIRIFNYKYADHYLQNGNLYFKTNIVNFITFFGSNHSETFYTVHFDCSDNLLSVISAHLSHLQRETGAVIIMPNTKYNHRNVVMHYNQPVRSKDFGFVNNNDLPVIIKTISSVLYVLKYTQPFVKDGN